MLLWSLCLLVSAGVYNEFIGAPEIEKEESNSTFSVVVPQVWTSASFNQCFEAYSLCIEGPPLERPISPACHQFPYWQDVGASWSMEMCAVPENGQRLLAILCSLWSTLEQSLGRERGPIQRGYVELFEAGSVTSDNTTRQIPMAGLRSPSRRTRRHGGKGQSLKGEGKGKSKKDNQSGAVGGKPAGFPDLPHLQAKTAWTPPIALVAPPVPQPIPVQSAENAQMKALMAALKKASSDLPPEIQAARGGCSKTTASSLQSSFIQLSRSSMPRKLLGTCTNHGAPSWKPPLPDGKGMQRSLPSRTKTWRLRSRRPRSQ